MSRRLDGAFRLFTVFGLDVFLHWSWFLLAAVYVYFYSNQPGSIFSSPVWHLLVFVTLFGIVTLHEMGHALACRSVGGVANTIVLWPLGGIAFVRPPNRPGAVLWSIAAGPLVNVALVPVTIVACAAAGVNTTDFAALGNFKSYVLAITLINLILLIFNMLPVYPLDGGQVLQSILWFFIGRSKSLLVVAYIGMGGAVLIAATALAIGHTMLVIIAAFLGWQAYNGLRMAKALAAAEQGAIWRP
jgi:Zn-dependent protease